MRLETLARARAGWFFIFIFYVCDSFLPAKYFLFYPVATRSCMRWSNLFDSMANWIWERA